ncbi:MAG: ATP-binding protein [Gammaproteobacteria bacterium]|nr:ATP-binding protein [Gammaproteobacteria bacterium]
MSDSISFIKYFPLGLAMGKSFCNRTDERKQLIKNFEAGQHTLISSPRRYGKSSLAIYALNESRLPYVKVDLFVAVDVKMVEKKIIQGVKELLSLITSAPEQAISLIKDYIKNLKTKWVVGTDGVNIEITPSLDSDPLSNIIDALQLLEEVLHKKNRQAVFFIDEFQEIGLLNEAKGIEGAIRSVAQEVKNLVFVFSGSNRHILSNMFDNRARPLYMLCDRVNLQRINEKCYIKYLNHIAKLSWGKNLSDKMLAAIFKLTAKHPYYINALCNKIWSLHEKMPPAVKAIENIWQDYIFQEEAKTAKELSVLSGLKKKLLIKIAQGYTKELTTKSMLISLDTTSASVTKALRWLNEKDFLEKDRDGSYSLVDPLMKDSLNLFYLL